MNFFHILLQDTTWQEGCNKREYHAIWYDIVSSDMNVIIKFKNWRDELERYEITSHSIISMILYHTLLYNTT